MQTMRRLTWKILIFVFMFGIALTVIQVAMGIGTEARAREKLTTDIALLRDIVEDDNVLSIDILNGTSRYQDAVNAILNNGSTTSFGYDVECKAGDKVTNSTRFRTPAYTGVNVTQNPLKVYYLNSAGDKVYIDSYANCPNKGAVVFIELTINCYSPVLFSATRTNDVYSQDNMRRMTQITQEVKVIASEFYKGK